MAIHLADTNEAGIEFGDLLNERLGRSGGARVLAFVLAWDRLRDELERPPTPEELAHRYGWDRSTAYRDQDLFRRATGEATPERITNLLWQAVQASGGLGALLAARVTEEVDEREAGLRSLAEWEPELTLEELEAARRPRES